MGRRTMTRGEKVIPLPLATRERSLPHILGPLEGEGLLGFCLRLDIANAFPLGTVATAIKRHATSWHTLRAASWASGAVFDLRRLAVLSGNDVPAVEELTFVPSLRRLFESVAPIESLGHMTSWMCERCWIDRRLIRRAFLLEHVTTCLEHERRLVGFDHERCARLTAGGRQLETSAERPTPSELACQRDVARIWSLLLDTGTPEVVGAGYRVVSNLGRRRPPGIVDAARRLQSGRHAVATLVEALTALQIEPAVLEELLTTVPADRSCPNATCPRYTERSIPDPLGSVRVESHCPICGSRFRGRQIVSTFDIGHGERYPTDQSVRRAQRRLRRWKLTLNVECARMIAAGTPVTVAEAFARAGVPDGAYLRAERLGLTGLVRDAARRQRLAEAQANAPFEGIDMSDYGALMAFARDRDWIGMAEWAASFGVRPAFPDQMLHWTDRATMRDGLLDSVFSGAWAGRVRHPSEVLAVWALVQEQGGELLSDRWFRRRMKRFSSKQRPSRPRPPQSAP